MGVVIDSHTHLWAGDSSGPEGKAINSRFSSVGGDVDHQLDFFFQMMKRSGVDKALVYCNKNDAAADMIRPYRDKLIPFASVDMKDPAKATTDLEYAVNSLGFKGINEQAVPNRHFYIDDFELLDPIYKKASDLGIAISWHLQDSFLGGASRSKFSGVSRMQEVCVKYPDLKILICHLGGLVNYRATLSGLSGYVNVYMDLSGLTNTFIWRNMTPTWGYNFMSRYHDYIFPEHSKNGKPADYEEVMRQSKAKAAKVVKEAANFIPDRIMFGTDAPFASRMELEKEVCEMAAGDDKKLLEHILGENAKTFLDLN
ncbi:MAG: amidohydrolase family protein [Nitrososphaerota archaeon]|nr:amidohydrolase family protein [Nitrososphaerota archaeon]